MIRKIFALALVLALTASLAACTATVAAGDQTGTARSGGNTSRSGGDGSANHSGSGAPTGERISEEEAQRIALEHAGLKADQVKGLRVSYDVDDGVPEYEVEFHHDRWEYEYEIHAETGEIRSYDRDD